MKILLVCSGGMSTSLLVQAIKDSATSRGIECEVEAIAASIIGNNLSSGDVILVAPQVRHLYTRIEDIARQKAIPVTLIPPLVYGKVDGTKALELALEIWEKKT